MDNNVLVLDNVQKKIGKKTIVENITFTVNGGEVFGFLGPNGAGKTTTIRMIVGLIKPTEGNISICGYSLKKDFSKAMENIGCIVENPELYPFMSGMDNLKHFGVMKGSLSEERYKEVVDLVGLGNRIKDRVSTYSLGMRQRLGLAQALLTKPKLLILDEPTNGLDPAGINEFRELIKTLAHKEQMAVFVSSHLLSEIQLMVDRVAIISQGRIIKVSKIEELIEEQNRVMWEVSNPLKASEVIKEYVSLPVEIKDNHVIGYPATDDIPKINEALVKEGVLLLTVQKKQRTLEELFLELTRGNEIV